MEMVFLKILNMSIAASWVALAVLVLRFALKKTPKWVNVALWALVAVRLVCPFSFESVLSLIPSTETVPEEIVYAAQPVLDTGVTVIDEIVNPMVTESLAPAGPINSVNPVQVWLFIGGILWVMGMGLMLLYGAVSYFRVRGKVRASIHLSDNIYLCDYIDTPFILGVFRPKIYLPSSMDPGAAAHVLSHERAHIQRRDHWWKPLGFGLLTVHWFNPVLWLAYVLLCRDIEMACDEKVVRKMAIPDKKAYSEALLRCSVSRRMIAACPLAFGEVGVKERVKTVLNYKKPAFWVVLIAVIALIVAAVCLLTDPVKDINGQRKFDLPGPNAADMDVQDIMTNIRKFTGLEKNENPYVNDYINDVILRGNFDLELVHIPYFYDRDGKTYLSVAVFSDLAESCTLGGQYEWEEQTTRFLFEHYLNALKYLPQERIQAMLPNTEHYRVRFVEEGTPGSYDRVIRYSDRGIGTTNGWLIHLEVVPTYHENGGFHDTGEPSIHLFYGDEPADVNGVILDAKILEISNKSYLVEPMPGSQELNSADKIWVQMELDTDPMPQVGDILRITYDGQLMETYPAQLGEVFGIRVVTGEYGIAQKLGKDIVHFNDKISLGIQIPEGWEYERVNTASDSSILEIRFRPAGEEGWVSLRYESAPFGVCGTGLTTENISFGSYEATQGFYDGSNIWSYISLHEELPGDYVILNDGADSWLHNANHHSLLWRMLETIEISEISQENQASEYVTYSQDYINMAVPKLDGWEYEITEYDGSAYRCGIRFRPEGEQGWLNLQWGHFSVPKQDRTVTTRLIGNASVEVGSYLGEAFWRYMHFPDAPDHYTIWNEDADGWLGASDYQQEIEAVLSGIRVAEDVLWKDELLSKIRWRLFLYSYETLTANMNQYTGVWSVDLHRKDGTGGTELKFDQEGNFLSSDEFTSAAPTEGMALGVQEYVTYGKNYVSISVPRLEGWKYEITEWQSQVTGNMLSCGIKLRPEGEEGWIAVRYYSDLQMALDGCDAPEQEISKESWPNYEVEISREPGSDSWLYIRYLLYEDDPKIFAGTHMAWNNGADEWLGNEAYYSQLMEILQNVRLAEGILLENEALAIARSAVENGDNLDYTVYRDRGEGNATGFTRVYLYDEGMDTFWNVKVDNEGNVRTVNGQYFSRVYKYEKEGFGGNFIIKLSGDGVAMYYEGGLSSYIGMGKWKQEGDFVTVTVEQKQYRFCLEENALVFIAEGSSSFTYVEVADGDRFILQEG